MTFEKSINLQSDIKAILKNTSDDLAVSSINNDDLTVSADDDLLKFTVSPDLPDWVRMPPYHITTYHSFLLRYSLSPLYSLS